MRNWMPGGIWDQKWAAIVLAYAEGRLYEFRFIKSQRPLDPSSWDMHHENALKDAVKTLSMQDAAAPESERCQACGDVEANHRGGHTFDAGHRGEQAEGTREIEAIRNALSKLESQICRNPDLPEAYRAIVNQGFDAIQHIEFMWNNFCDKHRGIVLCSTGPCVMCKPSSPAPAESARERLLKAIADFVNGYQLVAGGDKAKESIHVLGWNDGVATAASQVLDENDNQPLCKAIDEFRDASLRRVSQERDEALKRNKGEIGYLLSKNNCGHNHQFVYHTLGALPHCSMCEKEAAEKSVAALRTALREGEHLCKTVEGYMKALNDFHEAEEAGGEACFDEVKDYWCGLNSAIHEFRKRASALRGQEGRG